MSVSKPLRKEGQLEINIEARALCAYTLNITSNEKHFSVSQKSFTEKIRDAAIEIHLLCWEANNIKVNGEEDRYQRRISLEEKAADKCNRLAALIDVAKPVFHLSTKRTLYWMGLTLDLRNKIRAWHMSDSKRLKPN